MALMFQRLARNFAKNGYFPTDEKTTEGILSRLVFGVTKNNDNKVSCECLILVVAKVWLWLSVVNI